MALQAKFLKIGKGGTLAIYEVRGTSTELANFISNNYKDREPVFKSTPDGKPILSNGNKTPLYFTSYPLPGKNMWHPLYQIQMGDNAGSWTLDKSDLQFETLVSKSMGADFGQAYAAEAAKRYADSTPVSSSTAAMLSDDEDDADEEDFTATASDESEPELVASEDATMDVEETSTPKAKTTK
jgi:hypothetical protein